MKSNKKNKLKILGLKFKSIDSFLIILYSILLVIVPLSTLVGYLPLYSIFSENILFSLVLIFYSIIILSIIIVYLILLIRMFKYKKTIEEKKLVLKLFVIVNIVTLCLLFIAIVIGEIIRCKNYGEACGLGLTIAIIAFIWPVFLIMLFLIFLMSIPLIIAKIKEKK